MRFISLVLLLLISISGYGQESFYGKIYDLGLEGRVYPAGYIFMIRGMMPVGEHGALNYLAGYNTARRQDFGEHDHEEGGGPGISSGYRYYFNRSNYKGLFLGATLDLWFLKINWEDFEERTASGTTNITILQPLINGGYQYRFKNNPLALEAGLAFGREWNIITRGEEVGQGGISIAYLSVSYKM